MAEAVMEDLFGSMPITMMSGFPFADVDDGSPAAGTLT